jgi:hypothetical protein
MIEQTDNHAVGRKTIVAEDKTEQPDRDAEDGDYSSRRPVFTLVPK